MRKSILVRLGASALLSATLGVGLVHAASGNIDGTGPRSNNQIEFRGQSSFRESNNTNVGVSNSNYQSARSGDAIVRGNTFGGDATSGNASNSNQTSTNVTTGTSGVKFVAPVTPDVTANISDTGPHSNNQIDVTSRNSVDVSNRTNVNVSNINYQSARSGDAIVSGNTYGGNARSGDASNYNSVTTNVNVGSDHYQPVTSDGYAPSVSHYRAPMVYSEVGSPVYGGNHVDCGTCGVSYNHKMVEHQDKHYPVRHNYPTKSNGGLHSSNPCANVSEVSYVRENQRPCDNIGYGRRKVVPVVHYVSRPVVIRRPVYVRPCAAIAHPVVRPPCPVVVVPCHRQIDCGRENCQRTQRCERNNSRDCGQHQNHRSCR